MDWEREAAAMDQEAFVAAHPHPFLVGRGKLVHPDVLQKTGVFDAVTTDVKTREDLDRETSPLVVAAVRKVQDLFPAMITVGRTRNNDIVIEDALVSKFHAFFRGAVGGRYEVADAGSANGTRINGARLKRKNALVAIKAGDLIQFASSELRFLGAADAWRALRRME